MRTTKSRRQKLPLACDWFASRAHLLHIIVLFAFCSSLSFGQNTGIGVVEPKTALDVQGTGLFRNGNPHTTVANDQLRFGYNGLDRYMHSVKTRHNGSDAFGNAIDFYAWDVGVDATTTVGTQHVMSIEGYGGGRVGIGTTTPDAKLDIEGGRVRFSDYGNNAISGTATSILGVEADGDLVEVNAANFTRNIYDVDGTLVGNRAVTQNNFDLNFDSNTLVISGNDDRVGIGNVNPSSMLSVGTPISVGNIPYAESSITVFTGVNNGGNTPAAPEDMLHLVREGVAGQAWGNRASFELSRYENSGTNSRSQLDLKLANTTFSADNTVLSLRSNGNVGIGTTTPVARMDVSGGYVNVNENYGIMGENSVQRGLFFTDSGMGNSTVIRSSSALYYAADANNNTVDGTSLDGSHVFGSNALTGGDVSWTEHMRLTSGGNLGIGETDPASRLEVAGRTTTTNFTMTSGAAVDRILRSDANGNASWVSPSSVLAFTDTDDQSIRNLGFSGTTLTVGIEDGSSQTVSLAALADNQSIRNLGLLWYNTYCRY